MKLITFIKKDQYELGIYIDQGVIDVASASLQFPDLKVPTTVHEAIESGETGISALQQLVERVVLETVDTANYLYDASMLKFGPCVTHPNKIICVGLNYRKHAAETKMPIPEYPILFNKFNNTLAGHCQDIELPKASQKVDYEAELTIVMGKQAKNVTPENALSYVYGYCAANDLSARDLQVRTPQWLLGKTCDGFAPVGPYLVTADEVGDPNDLVIKSFVNREERQKSNTSDMIFPCHEIVSYISQHFTLEPGDLILTGTPEGVVMGYPPEKQVYLKDGDVVTIEIEKLGLLTNRLVSL